MSHPRRITEALASAVATGLLVAGCAVAPTPAPTPAPTGPTAPSVPAETGAAAPHSPEPRRTPASARPFDAAAARTTIEQLAGLGPREATGEAYAAAADQIQAAFERNGYEVTRQELDVPAGNSWGVRVPAGRTSNVIADPPGFDRTRPHVIAGAHLDTVPQAPGAEDNASGVAVMLELARMVGEEPAGLPVRFIAFGAEEPRGPGDSRHHFGSRHFVAELDQTEQQAITAMVSLDRVGVASDAVPLAHGGRGTDRIRQQLADSAEAVDIPVRLDANTTSDHWSFDKAGIPAARIGSVPYAGYHSAGDVPSVIDNAQLDRVGRVAWTWLDTL